VKVNYEKVDDLTASYINGNWSFVRSKIKTINKAEFYFLVQNILQLKDNIEPEEIVYNLTLKTA
jgi:hypothetical protein